MKILITGAAGYIGSMLADQLSKKESVSQIFCIDKDSKPEILENNNKILFLEQNLFENNWQEKAKEFAPEVVIHTAWQIREMYGKKELQWKLNINSSNSVFDFAFSTSSVKKIIHFSTIASYGAFPENTIEHLFTEEESFRKTDYLYAEEKRIAEENLREKFLKNNVSGLQVFVVRPASITGPRGRSRTRFGLQSALSGQLKGSFIYNLVSLMLSFVPITKKWCRQFIHEDDVNDIVENLVFQNINGSYEIFNLCPPGEVVLGKDMAALVNKKAFVVSPWMIRMVFFFARHLTHGKITTSKGGWKSYSFPIAVDGSKVTKKLGYVYKFSPKDAFVKKEGRYAKYIKP